MPLWFSSAVLNIYTYGNLPLFLGYFFIIPKHYIPFCVWHGYDFLCEIVIAITMTVIKNVVSSARIVVNKFLTPPITPTPSIPPNVFMPLQRVEGHVGIGMVSLRSLTLFRKWS